MSRDVKEQILILWCWILWSVWSGIAHDHQNRLVGVARLGVVEEPHRVVGDQVGVVVVFVVEAVSKLQHEKHVIGISDILRILRLSSCSFV